MWRQLDREVPQAIPQVKALAPGRAMDTTHTWNQKSQQGQQVPAGRYVVRGSLLTDAQTTLASAPATLEIVRRRTDTGARGH